MFTMARLTSEEAMKKLATALSLAALLTVPVMAQETPAPKNNPAAATGEEKTTNYSGQISVSDLLNELLPPPELPA